jgi:hypothetical protein
MLKKIHKKIKNKIWSIIKDFFIDQRLNDNTVVQNINYKCSYDQKKLLICYKAQGFFVNMGTNFGRTVFSEIFKIVKVFSELGYCIDIIDCNANICLSAIKEKKYDVVFGFGDNFYYEAKKNHSAISILYMTENHPDFSLREETKRIEYFYERHKRKAQIERSGNFYKSYHFDKKYSHVITLGETEILKEQYSHPKSIYPTGIINSDFAYKIKNHKLAKKNFLWLGSKGAIHKGLDILIDIFSKRDDIILHVCGLTREDKKQINFQCRNNIIDYGHINIKSNLFLKIIETCTYSILPSCSEGFATSITTGMLHGLIPIVMKNSGFNKLGQSAIFLDDYKIEFIDAKLTELANIDEEHLSSFSKKVFDFARENFLISTFENNFRTIIKEFLFTND